MCAKGDIRKIYEPREPNEYLQLGFRTIRLSKLFCNNKMIEILFSPMNNSRVTDCVERTIGSWMKIVLTYAKEKDHENLK